MFNNDGLCRNSTNPDDPRPRINACEDLVTHLTSNMRLKGRARLRTKKRTPEEAKRILIYSARLGGINVEVEEGESWVEVTTTDIPMPKETKELSEPPAVAHGFRLDDLDIAKLHLDFVESKRKANLYTQLASTEEGWDKAARDAWAESKQLKELIDAWEERHAV